MGKKATNKYVRHKSFVFHYVQTYAVSLQNLPFWIGGSKNKYKTYIGACLFLSSGMSLPYWIIYARAVKGV